MEIRKINKATMPNLLHNALMADCKAVLDRVTSENEKFKAVSDAFSKAFEDEEKWFKLGVANPNLGELHELSKTRAKVFRGMKQFLSALVVGQAESADKATQLLAVFDVYRINPDGNVQGVTSGIRNLLDDLAASGMQEALTATGAMQFYTSLKAINDKVLAQNDLRLQHEGKRVKAALQDARTRMDAAFDETARFIDCAAYLQPGEFEQAAKDWDAVVAFYKDVMKKRAIASEINRKKEEEQQQKPDGKPAVPSDPDGGTTDKPVTDVKPEPKPEPQPGDGKPAPDDAQPGHGEGTVTPVQPEKTAAQ